MTEDYAARAEIHARLAHLYAHLDHMCATRDALADYDTRIIEAGIADTMREIQTLEDRLARKD